MELLKIWLPMPPTVNHYYFHQVIKGKNGKPWVKKGISKKGTDFYARVEARLKNELGKYKTDDHSRFKVSILMCPPDRRKRDIDNIQKILLDSLTEAGFWDDDSQVDDLRVVRGPIRKGGNVLVKVSSIGV